MFHQKLVYLTLVSFLSSAGLLHAEELPNAPEWWISKSDQYIWDWIPDLKIHGVAHEIRGCPICGEKIFESRGHFPFLWHPDRPYKIQCPVCERLFPTNDYQQWMLDGRKKKLDTTQKYVDDGNGYLAPDGTRFPFIKYAIGEGYKQCIWSWVLSWQGLPGLGGMYAQTGKEIYAHKAAVIMARIATEYPKLNADRPDDLTLEQVRQLKYERPPQMRLATIGGPQVEALYLVNVLKPYMRIKPYLKKGGDAELRKFLAVKGINDVKTLIEQDLCHELILGGLEGNFSGNILKLKRVMAQAAQYWDMHDPSRGATTEYILQWVRQEGPHSLEEWLYNHLDRDGFTCTEGLGYNFKLGLQPLTPLISVLKDTGINLYQEPRIREAMRAPTKVVVAGKWTPSIGDGGGPKGDKAGGFWSPKMIGPAFEDYGDPLLAQALANYEDGPGKYTDKVEKVIEKIGREMKWTSRNYPVFGLAIFESGAGKNRRGLTCYYGGTTAHGHNDRLTISLFNQRGPVIPDLGYPQMDNPERYGWTSNTSSHNTVVVDAQRQTTREPGHLNLFSVAPSAQALEVDGRISYRGIVSKYRRTLIYVDTDEANSYLVDVFRVEGGSQHDYSVHGASADVLVSGIKLSRQAGGTLAGPDIRYLDYYDDQRKSQDYQGSGFQYLFNVASGSAGDGLVARWNHWKNPKPFLRVHVPSGVAEKAMFADGIPPFGKKEDALRYLFLRNGNCPPYNQQFDGNRRRVFPVGNLKSTFVTILEPIDNEAFIEAVKTIPRTESIGSGDAALQIHRKDGIIDTIICLEKSHAVNVGEIRMQGRIALCSRKGGQPVRMALLDGVSMQAGKKSLSITYPLEGTVRSVDYKKMAVTVTDKLPAGDRLAGKTIVFFTPPRSTSFVIDSVETVPNGSRILLRGTDAIACRAKVSKVIQSENKLMLNSAISILNAGSALAGMRLCNDDRSCEVRIRRFSTRWGPTSSWPPFGGDVFVDEGADLEKAFAPKEGQKVAWATVYEFGSSDRYRICESASWSVLE